MRKSGKFKLSAEKIVLFSLSVLFFIVLFFYFIFSVSAFSGSGEGTQEVPFEITNCIQLQEMGDDLNANYILMNDIDCSETISWNNGEGFMPVGDQYNFFSGSLDGKGYKISNLYSRAVGYSIGLFGFIGSTGVVSNFSMENVDLATAWAVGSVAGTNLGIIDNCFASGIVSGGSSGTGGLVGFNGDRTTNGPRTISNSHSDVAVTGVYQIGGLVGINYGTVLNSFSTGSVNGLGNIGGLIGFSSGGPAGIVTNSFWDMGTSGMLTSAGGVGKPTSEMMLESTFVDWDFADIWRIDENITYPYLFWETAPVLDSDGDGSFNNLDCATFNPEIYPGATEVCNNIDDNCDGNIDEDLTQVAGDAGVCIVNIETCLAGNWINNNEITPTPEICDSLDNDCDGVIDEDVKLTFYEDLDEDNFGDIYSSIQACSAPEGYVSSLGDCNDINPEIHPGVTEICNGKDDNCDNVIDEGFADTDIDGLADCIDLNDDDDSFIDQVDACPAEDSSEYDANNDGCIDRLVNFTSVINNIPNNLLSSNVKKLFTLEINLAVRFNGRDRDKVAMVMLRVLISQIESQRNKKISSGTADMLIAYANNVLTKMRIEN